MAKRIIRYLIDYMKSAGIISFSQYSDVMKSLKNDRLKDTMEVIKEVLD